MVSTSSQIPCRWRQWPNAPFLIKIWVKIISVLLTHSNDRWTCLLPFNGLNFCQLKTCRQTISVRFTFSSCTNFFPFLLYIDETCKFPYAPTKNRNWNRVDFIECKHALIQIKLCSWKLYDMRFSQRNVEHVARMIDCVCAGGKSALKITH